jgi:uncharacterized protein
MSRVVHFEIHAEDPQRAINFYANVFGWQFSQWGDQPYWVIVTGPSDQPGINGGLLPRRGQIDGQAVIAYVCTIDVISLDDTIAAIEANHGILALPKMAMPGVGWLAYYKDTEGNIFGVIQADPQAS